MAYFDHEPIDITPPRPDFLQEAIPGIDLAIELAETRRRHIGQEVLALEEVMV